MNQQTIAFNEKEVPYSLIYNDIYFSESGALQEKYHVFIHPNKLIDRWKNKDNFTIFEFGFGFGINFFCTLLEWTKMYNQNYTLEYVAVESNLVSIQNIEKLIKKYPEFQPVFDVFYNYYENLDKGFHHIHIHEFNVTLKLYIGDVKDILLNYIGSIDVFYLDGFSPSKNPEIWSDDVFQFIQEHSRLDATFSTYTVAQEIRERAERYGYKVEKLAGFGKKSEILFAKFLNEKKNQKIKKPWLKLSSSKLSHSAEIAIIGSGLAGTAIGFSLSSRGKKVHIIDKEPQITPDLSIQLAGMFSPLLTADITVLNRLTLSALLYFNQHLQYLQRKGYNLGWKRSGVIQIPENEKDVQRLQKAIDSFGYNPTSIREIDEELVYEISGIIKNKKGFYSTLGGYVNPFLLRRANLDAFRQNIEIHLEKEIDKIEHNGSYWTITNQQTNFRLDAEILIIANSYSSSNLDQLKWLPIRTVRGQIMIVPRVGVFRDQKTCILHPGGYLIPLTENKTLIGSTYNPKDTDPNSNPDHNELLYERLRSIIPNLPDLDPKQETGLVGFRATVKDHLPIAGPVPDRDWYLKNYHDIWKGKKYEVYPDAKYLPNLYLSVGLGSRGLIYGHLIGELIAALIYGESLPIEKDIMESIHPARFIIKDLYKDRPKS